MRRIAATFLLAAFAAITLADDTPPLKAGLRPAGTKPDDTKKADEAKTAKPVAPMPKSADDKKADAKRVRKEIPRPDRLKNARDDYENYCTSWVDGLRHAETEKEKAQLLTKLPNPASNVGMAAQLVLENPKDEVAFDALQWIYRYRTIPEVKKILLAVPPAKKGEKPGRLDVHATLIEHHIANPKLANLCRGIWEYSTENEALLEAVFEKATDAKIRGFAGAQLAEILNRKSEDIEMPHSLRVKFLQEAESILTKLIADKDVMAIVTYKDKDKDGKEHTLGESLPGNLHEVRELSIGKTMPELVSRGLDETTVKSDAFKGKVVVLDVWTTWCGPCRAMIPHERKMVARFKDKPFALVSVSCDDEQKELNEFLEKESMPWTHWFDGKDGPVTKALNVQFFPTIYVIDAKGVIRYKNIREEKLEEAVNKLIKEAEAAGGSSSGGR